MNNIIHEIKNSEIWTKIHSDDDLGNIMSFLKRKDLDYSDIKELVLFLNETYDITNITNNFIVSIIMISKFPDELIGKERVEEEDLIVYKSKEIYNMLLDGKNIDNIHKKLVTFKIIFDEWKEKDKVQQLDILSEMYYKYSLSINETKDDENKEEYVKELKEMVNKIETSMKMITPNYKEHLENYKFKNVEYDSSVNKMIYTKIKYVYWENIRKEIFEAFNTKIYYDIIKDYLDLLNSIKVIVDTDVLEGLRDYDVNEDNLVQGCMTITKSCVKINKEIDSENYDDIYDMLITKINENNKYLVDTLKLCFDRLEIIKKIKIGINLKHDK